MRKIWFHAIWLKMMLMSVLIGIFCYSTVFLLEPAYAENVTYSSGRYVATTWDPDGAESKAYYRIDGVAIINEHDGLVSRSSNAIQHGSLDALGRATWSAGYITPTLWAKEASEDRESASLPNPIGWRDNKIVTISLYDGKNDYHGYFYNRSHLVADSLGGDPIKENLVTGTRTQNVGANDGKGGMAYSETIARNYMKTHPQATLYYSATPVYVNNELVPRSVYIDMKSDDGTINSHIEVYNTARGYYVNYQDGTWGIGDPNSTRTNAPQPTYPDTPSISLTDISSSTDHVDDITWLVAQKISTGFPDGTFRPYQNVARADMAAFLFRLAKQWNIATDLDLPSSSTRFSDVNRTTPHAQEIWWLADKGISTGWTLTNGKKEFRPYDIVARQDMAAFLFRLGKLANKGRASDEWQASDDAKNKFVDVSRTTEDNHHDEVWWLAENNISTGWKSGSQYKFCGLLPVARCDMAAFLHRLDAVPYNNSDEENDGDDIASVMVYVTDSGTKYHLDGCSSLSNSKHKISLSDALAQGYTACSRCKPPTEQV